MTKRGFYYCPHCKNMFEIINDSGAKPICCGDTMTLLVANSTDASGEKHVPALTRNGKSLSVQVGSVAHPMEEAHYIQWIVVAQGASTWRADLKAGQAPAATFTLDSDSEPVVVYEYCNLHGLWMAEG